MQTDCKLQALHSFIKPAHLNEFYSILLAKFVSAYWCYQPVISDSVVDSLYSDVLLTAAIPQCHLSLSKHPSLCVAVKMWCKMFGIHLKCTLTTSSVQSGDAGHVASSSLLLLLPQRLQHQLDCCFLTFSHQSCKAVGFYFSHQSVLFFCLSFQINIYPEDVWAFSLIFPFLPRVKIFSEPRHEQQCKPKITRGVFPVALQTTNCLLSFLLFCLFFPLSLFLFLIPTQCMRLAQSKGGTM